MSTKVKRVVMAKEVAHLWVEQHSTPEYRFYVMASPRYFARLLKAFRDGKARIAGLSPFSDFGIKEASQGFHVWSSDLEKLRQLDKYFQGFGIETTWIWS